MGKEKAYMTTQGVFQPFDLSQDEPRCVVFTDLRGDYRLLLTLLSQLARVAEFDAPTRRWRWTVTNTVVVCLGNYTDRFEPRGLNRLTVSTKAAIADELRILETFIQLEQPNDEGNAMVVLAGDHELANLCDLPGYEYCQMAQPQEPTDRELRRTFVHESLRPFVQRHGLVAGWGRVGGTVYFSHGSLTRSWLQKIQAQSLEDVNRKWQHWVKDCLASQLARAAESDSPLFSSVMALKPQVWRESDADWVVQLLGADPNPRFVQATLIPVQRLHFFSYDTNLREPQFDRRLPPGQQPTMLVSRSFDAVDECYFIHNAMADTFCMYEDTDRQPQALQFNLTLNNMAEALFLRVKPLVMSFEEYQLYLRELPYGSCAPPAALEDHDSRRAPALLKAFSPEEQIALRPTLGRLGLVNAGASHVESVGLVLLSHNLSRLFMVSEASAAGRRSDARWSLPLGHRRAAENDWDAMMRVLQETAQLGRVEFVRGGTVSDFDGTTRVWFKRTLQSLTSPLGQWVDLDDVLSGKFLLTRQTRTMLCVFAAYRLMPPLKNALEQCPAWLRAESSSSEASGVPPWWSAVAATGGE